MNLLPIVIAFLLMMAALSYSELALLAKRGITRNETLRLVDFQIARAIDQGQEKEYEESVVHSSTVWNKNQKIDATAKINLSLLLNGMERNDHSEALFLITKRLIDLLYSQRLFYQEAKENNSDLAEALLNALIEKLAELEKQGELPKKANEIANVELDDPDLESVFAEMLSEVPKEHPEKKSEPYYDTLINYISFSKESAKPIRLWLANEPLLNAIYGDSATVKQLIAERKSLYREYKGSQEGEREESRLSTSAQFEQLFKRELPNDMPLTLFNFEVSLTNPN